MTESREILLPEGVEVDPGIIRLNSIRQLVHHPDVEIYEIECRSKYADPMYSCMGDEFSLDLWANNETLYVASELAPRPTRIKFAGRGRWLAALSGGRYTFYLCLFTYPAVEQDAEMDRR